MSCGCSWVDAVTARSGCGWRWADAPPTGPISGRAIITYCRGRSTSRATKAATRAPIERFNNILRQRLAQRVRKTLAFAKCSRRLEITVERFIHRYNAEIRLSYLG